MDLWKNADGEKISDSQLIKWINSKILDEDLELIVGTDSHLHKHLHKFITVICLYKKGRGGYYYYKTSLKEKKDFKGNYPSKIRAKMFHEASLSIEEAQRILDVTGLTPIIHIDASPPENGELTSMFSDQLKGYVVASGFECFLKPWSFVASSISNKHSK